MARRMIDSGMWSNENFAALPSMGRLLLIGIITLADDQGRCKANPAYLRSQIFPYEDIATSDVDRWLQRMEDNGTLILYATEGKAYLQLINWWTYQPLDWARPSEYPAPEGWQDRIRFNGKGNVNLTYNWRTKSGTCLPDNCDSRGVPTQVPTKVDTQAATQVPTQAGTQVNQSKLNQSNLSNHDDRPTDPPSLAQRVFDRLQEEWMTVNPAQADGHTALAERYGYDAWLVGLENCSRGKRSIHSYVEKAILSAIDAKPSLAKKQPKAAPTHKYIITDPVTGERKEVLA